MHDIFICANKISLVIYFYSKKCRPSNPLRLLKDFTDCSEFLRAANTYPVFFSFLQAMLRRCMDRYVTALTDACNSPHSGCYSAHRGCNSPHTTFRSYHILFALCNFFLLSLLFSLSRRLYFFKGSHKGFC